MVVCSGKERRERTFPAIWRINPLWKNAINYQFDFFNGCAPHEYHFSSEGDHIGRNPKNVLRAPPSLCVHSGRLCHNIRAVCCLATMRVPACCAEQPQGEDVAHLIIIKRSRGAPAIIMSKMTTSLCAHVSDRCLYAMLCC